MALTKKEKVVIYDQMLGKLKDSDLAFFASFKGLPTEEIFEMKRKMKGNGTLFKLVKNSLLKKAFGDLGFQAQEQSFWKGETAMVAGVDADAVRLAKVLVEWAKQNQKVKIKGGLLTEGKKWLTDRDIKSLATLPGMQELRGQMVNAVAGPLISLQYVLKAVMTDLLLVLTAIERKEKK